MSNITQCNRASKEENKHIASKHTAPFQSDSKDIQLCRSIQDTQNFAQHFLERLETLIHNTQKIIEQKKVQKKEYDSILILLYGKIGAGKSTFVRLCLELLDLCNTCSFSSPSFSLANEYPILSEEIYTTNTTISLNSIHNIVHVDLYRLHSVDELYDIDLFAETHTLFFVEWPDTVPFQFFEYLHIPIISIHFNIIDEYTRSITCIPSIVR